MSDGTTGMRFQAIALAQAITAARPDSQYHDHIVQPHRIPRSFPSLAGALSLFPLYGVKQPAQSNSTPNNGVPAKPLPRPRKAADYPDILITCGRRMAGISIGMRARARRAGAKMQTVHLQDPRLDPALFDALIVPSHDPTRGDNVLVTLGSLNRLTRAAIAEAAKGLPPHWLNRDNHAPVAVMLGGDNARYRISRKMIGYMAMELGNFAQMTWIDDKPVRLLLVPSRRTPPQLLDQLSLSLGDVEYEIATHLAPPNGDDSADSNPLMENPYPGVLAADAIIVTADSVNMVSEAAITGKPVLIAGWRPDHADSCGGETGRIGTFHRAMIAGTHTAILSPYSDLSGYEALDERPALTQKLLGLLER
ncbi:mitochondrial fission ELM1 family protein [Alphaproteobacteria bacterium]|nr:mitochondrial fission ELM1 family protein [Alphaproteobacteria bacterium]